MRRAVAVFSFVCVLAIALVTNGALAASIGVSPVQLLVIDSPAEIRLGTTATYTFAAFNGGNTTYLVQGSVLSTELGLDARIEPFHLFLRPLEDGQFNMTLQAPLAGQDGIVNTNVEFVAVNLATGDSSSLVLSLEIRLLGITPEEDPTGKIFGLWENQLPAPFNNPYGAFLLTLAFWVIISVALVFVVGGLARRLGGKRRGRMVLKALHLLRIPIFVFVFAYGAVNSLQILGIQPELMSLLLQAYSLIVVVLATWIGYRVWRDVVIRYATRRSARARKDLGKRALPSLDKLGGLVIVIVGFIIALQSLGFNITVLLAGLGVLGIVIAFAAQDTLSNLFAGLHLMADKPFQIGDLIEMESGLITEVVDIGLRSTKLYSRRDNNLLIVPNNEIANKPVVNYLRPDFRYRMHVKIGVAYGSDLAKVERVLREIALAHPEVLEDEEHKPEFWVDEFADSSINCRLIAWIRDARNHWRVRSDLNKEIDRRFREEGVQIPFPQRDVWMRGPEKAPPD